MSSSTTATTPPQLSTITEISEESNNSASCPPPSPQQEKEVIIEDPPSTSTIHTKVQLNDEFNSCDALQQFKRIIEGSSAFDGDDIRQIDEEIARSERRILKLRQLCNSQKPYSDSVLWMNRKVAQRMKVLKECENVVDFKHARFSKLGGYFVQKQVGLKRDLETLTTCAKNAATKTNP